MNKCKVVIAALLIFLLGFTTISPSYKPLNGISFPEKSIWHSKYIDMEVNYVYFGYNDGLEKDSVLEVSRKTEVAIIDYAKENNYPINDCRGIKTLDVYYVSHDDLNNKERFPGFINEDLKEDDEVWGTYDPVLKHVGYSVIVLTNPGGSFTEKTQAHELSHYWYDRFCWERYWDSSPEDFALDFEKFYEKKIYVRKYDC